MDDVLLVRGDERVGKWDRYVEQLRQWQATGPDDIGKGTAIHQFHREEAGAGGLLDGVQDNDVRVIEPGDRGGFALEARKALRRGRDVMRQHFDGDVALEPRGCARDRPRPCRRHQANATISEGPSRVAGVSAIAPVYISAPCKSAYEDQRGTATTRALHSTD